MGEHNETWEGKCELCYMAGIGDVQERKVRTSHKGPNSVSNLAALTFTQVQSFIHVLIVTYYQWSEVGLE
jgi:hypothetical protein